MSNQYPKKEENPITASGFYTLTLYAPKLEWIKPNPDNTISYRLYFKEATGKSLKKYFGSKYPKEIPMLIGKISKTFVESINTHPTPQEFYDLIMKGVNKPFTVYVEVGTSDTGKPKYKLDWKREVPKDYKAPLPEQYHQYSKAPGQPQAPQYPQYPQAGPALPFDGKNDPF